MQTVYIILNSIYNYFKSLKHGLFLSDVYQNHRMTIIIRVFLHGYRGKKVDFALVSQQHRTTTAYFLNHGKWNDSVLQDTLKSSVILTIYQETERSGQPILCIVDDTIASHARLSSLAVHPIEAAYFHRSHLKGRQDYGHQAVSVMLSCNGIILNYAIVLYDKSKSKIKIVQEIAEELPVASVISYFLCVRRMDPDVSLVTVGSRKFYVYRYEGELNDIPNAAVIISYLEESFGEPKALRIFISTNYSGKYCGFEEGYQYFRNQIKTERLGGMYRFIKNGASFEAVLESVG